MITLVDILIYLIPNAEWSLDGDSLEGLVMHDDTPAPTADEIETARAVVQQAKWCQAMRDKRDGLLAASDWTQAADDPTGNAAAWAAYRQQLRDAPATWTPGPTWDAPEPPT